MKYKNFKKEEQPSSPPNKPNNKLLKLTIVLILITLSFQETITAFKPMLINNPDYIYRRVPYWDMGNVHKNIKKVEIVSEDPNYKILDGDYSSNSWLSQFESSKDYFMTERNHVF